MDRSELRDAPTGRLLVLAAHVTTQRWNRLLAEEYGLTQAGLSVLLALLRNEQATHREMADRCFVRPATLTGIIDTLERDGLVLRRRDGADRRVVRLTLTGPGRRRAEEIDRLIRRNPPLTSVDADPAHATVIREFLLEVIRTLGNREEDCPRPAVRVRRPGAERRSVPEKTADHPGGNRC